MRFLLPLAVLAVIASGCLGEGGGPPATIEERGDELEDVPLRADEAPPGLQEDQRGSGPVEGLRDVLPPRRTAPGLPEVPRSLIHDFEAGYQRLFVAEGGGPQSGASSALQFADSAAAAAFLELLKTTHDATTEEPLLESVALGEEAYGWTRQIPGAQTTGFVWRRGDLVLTVTVSARVGDGGPDRVLPVARRVDQRLG